VKRAAVVRLLLAVACLPLISCRAPDPIPTYPLAPAAESFDRMQQRSAQMRDVSGEGEITLSSSDGNSVRFDAAFALAPPDRARVRAWKFGQAVLDLTVTQDGAWLFLPRTDEHAASLRAAAGDASRALHEWLALLSNRPDNGATNVQTTPTEFIVTRNAAEGSTITSIIDRATLTPRQYIVRDDAGRRRFALALEAYRVAGSTVWPTKVKASAPNGKFIIELRDVLINQAPSRAFDHPARAERLP
jgi:outer membrane lipoprotein-sorting protein